jgi:cell division protein FtsL
MDPTALGRIAVTFACIVCSLGFVTWRQSRAFEAHRALDDVRRAVSVAQAEQVEIEREIQVLLSRARIVPEARALGMHTPGAAEQVILAGGGAP